MKNALSNLEIHKIIRDLNRINLENTEYINIQLQIQNFLQGLPIMVRESPSTEQLFRIRKYDGKKITKISEIMAPPPELIKGYQRCNPPHTSTFYAASDRITALRESRVCNGEIFYLSQWMPKKRYFVNTLIQGYGEDLIASIDDIYIPIFTYFDTILTRKIHHDFSSDYKLTAALSQAMMLNFRGGNIEGQTRDNSVAFKYPSVLSIDRKSHNTALTQVAAEDLLSPVHIMEARYIENSDGSYEIEVLDNCVDFFNGDIHWKNSQINVPLKKNNKSSIGFIVSRNKNDEKVIFLRTAEETPDKKYLIDLFEETQFS